MILLLALLLARRSCICCTARRAARADEHRAIFDVAVLCILAADPFSALNRRQGTASQLLVEVDVDDQSHILFGGSAPYVGWTRGTPTEVSGPTSFANALQFSGHEYLQLGDDGVNIEGNWTLEGLAKTTSQETYAWALIMDAIAAKGGAA